MPGECATISSQSVWMFIHSGNSAAHCLTHIWQDGVCAHKGFIKALTRVGSCIWLHQTVHSKCLYTCVPAADLHKRSMPKLAEFVVLNLLKTDESVAYMKTTCFWRLSGTLSIQMTKKRGRSINHRGTLALMNLVSSQMPLLVALRTLSTRV